MKGGSRHYTGRRGWPRITRHQSGIRILATVFTPQVTCRVHLLRPTGIVVVKLTGSITALATPFDATGAIDLPAWRRLISDQISAGSSGLVVAGSTGEAAALEVDEFRRILADAVAIAAGQVPILAGTGHSATAATIARTRIAAECGADAALVVTPPYVRPTPDGLIAHYRAVAEHGGLPVLAYNVPTRTGCDMQPETVAVLAEHPGIVGLKESVPDQSRWARLRRLRGAEFALLSGDDPTFCETALAGADGVISVASNVVPRAYRRLADLACQGRSDAARALDQRLAALYVFLAIEPNPIPVKALLAALGYGHGLRLPLLPLSDAHADRVRAMLGTLTEIESGPDAQATA